jgi:hypothetical protein
MNPFEVDIPNKDNMTLITNEIEKLEIQVKENKKIEERLKTLKENLVEEIEKRELLNWNWTTPNNIKFTYVNKTEDKEEKKLIFSEERFKKDHPDLYQEYLWESTDIKLGRKSYIRVTIPKEK